MLRDKLAAALAVVILAAGYCHDARADGLPKSGLVPLGEVAKAGSWTGLGLGIYGSWANADTDTSPLSLGSSGYTAGASISASLQMSSIVLEAFGEFGWVFGDLQDIGANNEMAVGGRLGYLINAHTMLYAVGAKSWVDTDFGTIDGWQYGGGVRVRFASTPTFLSLEYRHSEYDASSIGLPIDITSDSVRAAIIIQFGSK
jgi:hypothetical protein